MTIWTRDAIAALIEDDLSRDVLVPLFSAMGYQDVRFFGGGVLEQGKDIIMWREEAVRGRVNIAVVVKAVPITGKVITGEVINQLREAFGKEYLDPAKAEPIKIHEAFVLTSQEISKEGTHCLEGLVNNEPFKKYVEYIDSARLWRFIEKYLGAKVLLPTLAPTYRELSKVVPGVGLELNGDTLTLTLAQEFQPEAAIVQATFKDSPEGDIARESFDKFARTGQPVEVPVSSMDGLGSS